METFNIKEIILKRLEEKPKHKIEYSYQELGIELEEYFKSKRVWGMFHKVGYTEPLMRYAFKECKTRNINNVNYFEAIIKNKLK